MSHHHETSICPNCGYHADNKYCAQCGQPTHLHKDTLWGLIVHFFEHYFHYDSKFLKTMKALLFKPGELTLAYWKGQRMRYIPPISLYIFVSAIYFICSTLFVSERIHSVQQMAKQYHLGKTDDTSKVLIKHDKTTGETSKKHFSSQDLVNNPEMMTYITEKEQHVYPKFIFFMIPFMGLVLKLLFWNRKDLYFADHVIFSLHLHAFYFSITILQALTPDLSISMIVSIILLIIVAIYFVKAIQRAYNAELGIAMAFVMVIGIIYTLILGIAMAIYTFIIATQYMAK